MDPVLGCAIFLTRLILTPAQEPPPCRLTLVPKLRAALTPAQTALLDPARNPRLPYNLDSWDGYQANREAILQTVKLLNKKLVVLSGDSHNGWFTNLTTLAGEKVGVEFAGTSVSSPGFESAGLGGWAHRLMAAY